MKAIIDKGTGPKPCRQSIVDRLWEISKGHRGDPWDLPEILEQMLLAAEFTRERYSWKEKYYPSYVSPTIDENKNINKRKELEGTPSGSRANSPLLKRSKTIPPSTKGNNPDGDKITKCEGCGGKHKNPRDSLIGCNFRNHPDFNATGKWDKPGGKGEKYISYYRTKGQPEYAHISHGYRLKGDEVVEWSQEERTTYYASQKATKTQKGTILTVAKCTTCVSQRTPFDFKYDGTLTPSIFSVRPGEISEERLTVRSLLDTGDREVDFNLISKDIASKLIKFGAPVIEAPAKICKKCV